MDVEQFIEQNVKMSRGGYPPHEVAQLIRLAWQHARQQEATSFRDAIRGFAEQERATIDREFGGG
jgi:hypothetical protein